MPGIREQRDGTGGKSQVLGRPVFSMKFKVDE
jgi:hypothetical protein